MLLRDVYQVFNAATATPVQKTARLFFLIKYYQVYMQDF